MVRYEMNKEIQEKIKLIELKTRKLLQGSLVGNRRTTQRGYGIEFDQIRDYQMGDDVRFIDWKSTARSNKLLVKEYLEERSRTVLLAVDISASVFFGSGTRKADMIAEMGALLAFVAEYSSDSVGLLLFSDAIEQYIPPKKGMTHVHHIIQKLVVQESQHKKTDIRVALKYLAQLNRNDTIIFLLSDFIDNRFDKELAVVARRYELIPIRCLDAYEKQFPRVGILPVQDVESGRFMLARNFRKTSALNDALAQRITKQNLIFKKYGITYFDVPAQNYLDSLIHFLTYRIY